METIIAIDPGAKGGIAIGHTDGSIELYPMPKVIEDLQMILGGAARNGASKVVLEQVGGFVKGRGAGGSAMFNFGMNWGFIRGYCTGARIPLSLVTPQRWMSDMRCGTKGKRTDSEWKNHLRGIALRAHPGLIITLQSSDAILILDWANAKFGADDDGEEVV